MRRVETDLPPHCQTAGTDYESIPPRTIYDHERHGVVEGSVMRGLVHNDLSECMLNADAANRAAMREIVLFMHNRFGQADAWGSSDAVQQHHRARGASAPPMD